MIIPTILHRIYPTHEKLINHNIDRFQTFISSIASLACVYGVYHYNYYEDYNTLWSCCLYILYYVSIDLLFCKLDYFIHHFIAIGCFIGFWVGGGGADLYAPLENQDRGEFTSSLNDLINYCLTLPKWGSEFGGEDNMDVTPEILIGNLVNDILDTKKLKKALKAKVLFVNENGIYQTGYRGNRKVDQNLIDMVKDENPDSIILNCLAFNEALSLYRGEHA